MGRRNSIESLRVAEWVGRLAHDKKAEDVLILDMRRVAGFCDYFVICGASSAIRARTIADHIESTFKKDGVSILHTEGTKEGRWIVMDMGDVITHVFQNETRTYYNLENLWGDAPRRRLPQN